jgi:hypothetical protein
MKNFGAKIRRMLEVLVWRWFYALTCRLAVVRTRALYDRR